MKFHEKQRGSFQTWIYMHNQLMISCLESKLWMTPVFPDQNKKFIIRVQDLNFKPLNIYENFSTEMSYCNYVIIIHKSKYGTRLLNVTNFDFESFS